VFAIALVGSSLANALGRIHRCLDARRIDSPRICGLPSTVGPDRRPIQRRNKFWISLAATIGGLLCSVLWTSARAESVRDIIGAAEARWVKLYNAKDAAGLAKLYTADALRLAPDASRVQGRTAIQAQLQKEFDDGLHNIKFQETDSGYDANLVWLVGNFAVDYPGQQGKLATATGNYVVVYQKESDGVWRLVIDTWNEAPAK
jgi:uncharacterized protein (TIGR02246 family)